jgi:hypothetical protein
MAFNMELYMGGGVFLQFRNFTGAFLPIFLSHLQPSPPSMTAQLTTDKEIILKCLQKSVLGRAEIDTLLESIPRHLKQD